MFSVFLYFFSIYVYCIYTVCIYIYRHHYTFGTVTPLFVEPELPIKAGRREPRRSGWRCRWCRRDAGTFVMIPKMFSKCRNGPVVRSDKQSQIPYLYIYIRYDGWQLVLLSDMFTDCILVYIDSLLYILKRLAKNPFTNTISYPHLILISWSSDWFETN